MLFETLFASEDADDIPELWDYAANPTVPKARALLAALKLPAPYERLREYKRARSESPRAASGSPARYSRSRGGAPSAPAPAPPRILAAELVPSAIAVHESVDAIHDIHSRNLMTLRIAVPRILSGEAATALAQFPGLKESLIGLTERRMASTKFTYNAFATLNAAFGLNFQDDGLATLRSDRRLHEQVSRWRLNATTEIMLDGIVSSINDPAVQRDPDNAERITRIARSQALCAFVMLLLADYDPALAEPYTFQIRGVPAFSVSVASSSSVVEFLTGPFQTMDIENWGVYMRRWTRSIQRASPRLWKRITFREIAQPFKSASGALVSDSSARLPNGRVVPILSAKNALTPDEAHSKVPPIKGVDAFGPSFAVSAKKEWFRDLFDEYSTVSDAQRVKMEPLIRDAIAVNALRDALKADIALARGAVYVTYDRLAMMYYALRRTAESRGDGLWLYASGIGDAKLGVYE